MHVQCDAPFPLDCAPPSSPELEQAFVCTPLPEGVASCEDCDPDCIRHEGPPAPFDDCTRYGCFAEIVDVPCGPVDFAQDACCYVVEYDAFCVVPGRPLRVAGEPCVAEPIVGKADWLAPTDLVWGDEGLHRALARAWVADALLEHASVAAFARFVLQLQALGAPSDLVTAAAKAMQDEIEHARLCFGLAARHGDVVGPGPLVPPGVTTDFEPAAILTELVLEGCVGETVAAALAAHAYALATDAAARTALERIADDEADHALLAWRTAQWMLDRHPELQSVAADAFATAIARMHASTPDTLDVDPELWRHHGRLDPTTATAVKRATLADLTGWAAALLGLSRGPRHPELAEPPRARSPMVC